MAKPWPAKKEVLDLTQSIKEKYHLPRLDQAIVVVEFKDTKPFTKNRLNLGSVKKFSSSVAHWLKDDYTFCISLVADVWHEVMNPQQQEAWIDLMLTRCSPVWMPETVEVNGKKKVVKDDLGRVKYTNEQKMDKDGEPCWQVLPLDLGVFTENVRRYGLWYEDLTNFVKAVK